MESNNFELALKHIWRFGILVCAADNIKVFAYKKALKILKNDIKSPDERLNIAIATPLKFFSHAIILDKSIMKKFSILLL